MPRASDPSWIDVKHAGSDFLFGVCGDPAGRIFIVGQVWRGRHGLFLSTDGGRTFQDQDRPNKHDLRGVAADANGTVWAVGYNGTVLRWRDPSEGWKRVRAGLEGLLLAVHCRSPDEVFVSTGDGDIHRTTDGGKTWGRVHAGGGKTVDDIHSLGGALYASCRDLSVLTSEDGEHWRRVPVQVPRLAPYGTPTLGPLLVLREGVVLVGANEGQLLRSDDAGATWTAKVLPASNPNASVTAIRASGSSVFVTTLYDCLRSDDDGRSWTLEHSLPGDHHWFFDFWVGADGQGLGVGPHGTIVLRDVGAPRPVVARGSQGSTRRGSRARRSRSSPPRRSG